MNPLHPTVRRSDFWLFAGSLLTVCGALAALAWTAGAVWLAAGIALAGALLAVGLAVFPRWRTPVIQGAQRLFRPIGLIVNTIVLSVIFLGLVTPMALLGRLVGRDTLGTSRRARSRASYWETVPSESDPERALRQTSLAREVLSWLARTRKWWLLPLLLTLALVGLFLVLASTGAGPLLYALF